MNYREQPDPKRQLREAMAGKATTGVKQSRFAGLSRGLVRERGRMNATEQAYAAELNAAMERGEVARWWFEPFSLRLSHPDTGQPATFSPDFLVLMPDGTTYVDDTKGGIVDNAAVVRIKAAAELYPLWRFRLATKRGKKDGGGFDVREV